MDAAASKFRQPVDEREIEAAERAYARERQAKSAPLTQGRQPKTPSERELWQRFEACCRVGGTSRKTRRAVEALSRKCMRNGLLKHRKQPEDPADG